MGTSAQTEAVNLYQDRSHAGDVLAEELARRDLAQPTVLGLVRGGVPVAARVAAALHAPLDALVVRKLGVPWAPEVAFGALGPGGVRVLNPQVADQLSERDIADVTEQQKKDLDRLEQRYRPGRGPVELAGRTAVVVDDGLATGATARAAVEAVRKLGAARVLLAVPVGSRQAVDWLRAATDEVVCPLVPEDFGAVSRYFRTFEQVTDDTVVALLEAR
jgi:putative phosphoribosyl transferase